MMPRVTRLKGPRTLVVLAFTVIVVLVLAIGYSLQMQARQATEVKTIEAGVIESGDRPTLYFILRNPNSKLANYTYTITYNPQTEVRATWTQWQ